MLNRTEANDIFSSGVTIYMKGLKERDLYDIDRCIDKTFFDYCTNNNILGEDGEVTSSTYILKQSENLYVYENIVNGIEIPKSETRALELCDMVNKIIGSYITPEMSPYQKELVIHDYLVKNCEPATDDEIGYDKYTAYGNLILHQSVCQGYAEAFDLLMNCLGIECRFVTGEAGGSHGWDMIRIGKSWYHIDVTWDDPAYQSDSDEERVSHAFFNLSDEIISESHLWDKEDYFKCNDLYYNYYEQTGDLIYNYDEFEAKVERLVSLGSKNFIEVAVINYSEDIYKSSIIFEKGFSGSFKWSTGVPLDGMGYQTIYIELY